MPPAPQTPSIRGTNANAFAEADRPYLMQVYGMMHETQRYEGDGIWNRFNIVVSLHIVLLALAAYLSKSPPPAAHTLLLGLSLAGVFLALWALYSLNRLWLWHEHWKGLLEQLEDRFPPHYPRPLSSRPSTLRRVRPAQLWLLGYTQPFITIIAVIWAALFVLVVTHPAFPESSQAHDRSHFPPPQRARVDQRLPALWSLFPNDNDES